MNMPYVLFVAVYTHTIMCYSLPFIIILLVYQGIYFFMEDISYNYIYMFSFELLV